MPEVSLITLKSSSSLAKDTLQISEGIAECLNLQQNDSISLAVGQKSLTVRLKMNKKLENKSLRVATDICRILKMPDSRHYGIYRDDDGIHIGPVVGVMADLSNNNIKPFGGQSYFISQLLTAGRKYGQICYAFSPYSINFKGRSVIGYSYGKNGWHKAVFPMPDVVYPRESGYSPPKLHVRNLLEAQGCKFINPPLIGKWQTYKILSANEELLPHIPETRLVNGFKQVDSMVKRYRSVYMKPVAGSQGRNIIRIVRLKKSKHYQYQYQVNKQRVKGTANDLSRLQSSLKSVMGKRTYIVQQRINLLRSHGNIIDVRVLVQKDHSGEWSVTGKACRVGSNGSITSNISAGGSGRKVEQVLANSFSNQGKRTEISSNLDRVALEVARTMDDYRPAGEMGIDLGIDINGWVWFIETNLRPARQVFLLIGEKKTRMNSVEKPMLYARYLAGFERKKVWD